MKIRLGLNPTLQDKLEDFVFLIKEYAMEEDDTKMSKGAQEIKYQVIEFVEMFYDKYLELPKEIDNKK